MPDDTIDALVLVGLKEAMASSGLTTLGEELRRRARRLSVVLGGKGQARAGGA